MVNRSPGSGILYGFTRVQVGHCDWWSGYFKNTRLARWRWRIHLIFRHGKWSDYMRAGYAE
jgi:hypothetical protein